MCSVKYIYSQVSRDLARFPVFTVDSWLKICCCLCHSIGAKQLNLGFFCPHVCGLSHFEDLIRFKKYFSVYPVKDHKCYSMFDVDSRPD